MKYVLKGMYIIATVIRRGVVVLFLLLILWNIRYYLKLGKVTIEQIELSDSCKSQNNNEVLFLVHNYGQERSDSVDSIMIDVICSFGADRISSDSDMYFIVYKHTCFTNYKILQCGSHSFFNDPDSDIALKYKVFKDKEGLIVVFSGEYGTSSFSKKTISYKCD